MSVAVDTMFSRNERADALERLPDKQRLSIAFLVGRFPTRSETFISRKVDFLLCVGHDVHVFCNSYDRSIEHPAEWKTRIHTARGWQLPPGDMVAAGLRYARAAATGKINTHQLRDALREAKQSGHGRRRCAVGISRLVNRRWDVVHAHFLNSLDGFVGLRHLLRCPVIGAVYGYDVTISPHRDGGMRRLEAQLTQVDALTYSSEFLRKRLHDLVDVAAEETILPPEVPAEVFRARVRSAPRTPLRLLSVGRLHWTKGFPYALCAVRSLLHEGILCEYRIVGEGETRKELEYTIRELGLRAYVRLLGALPPAGVRDAMDWADILLLPSVREDFGNVLVEAQASGLPIVASKVGGTPEATTESVTALLIPPRDPQAICVAIKTLLVNESLYRSLSDEGPRYARKFDSERVGRQLVSFYRRVLANNHSK